MYRVYVYNFDYALDRLFTNLADAKQAGIDYGFQFAVQYMTADGFITVFSM